MINAGIRSIGIDTSALYGHIRQDVRKALSKVVKRVATGAKQRAPKGATKELSEGYTSETFIDQGGAIVGRAGTNLWRAHFTEFGTYDQEAKPHLRPAADEEFDAADGDIATEINSTIARDTMG